MVAPSEIGPATGDHGIRVLVVDDDPVLQLMTTHMLRTSVAEVACADSVASALSCLDGNDFDVVVCDYLMPGETGLALVEPCTDRGLRFILLTGTSEDDYVDDPRFGQVDAHLTKPIASGELVAAVLAQAAEAT